MLTVMVGETLNAQTRVLGEVRWTPDKHAITDRWGVAFPMPLPHSLK